MSLMACCTTAIDRVLLGLTVLIELLGAVLRAPRSRSAGFRGACLRGIRRAPRCAQPSDGAGPSPRRGSGRNHDPALMPGHRATVPPSPGATRPPPRQAPWPRDAARGKVNYSKSCLTFIDTYRGAKLRGSSSVTTTTSTAPSSRL